MKIASCVRAIQRGGEMDRQPSRLANPGRRAKREALINAKVGLGQVEERVALFVFAGFLFQIGARVARQGVKRF